MMNGHGRNVWRWYHATVRRLIPLLYQQVSAGRYWVVLALCSPGVHTHTPGDSALGGTRQSRRSYALWWRRVFAFCTALDLQVHEATVAGPPWNTSVETEWTDHITALDGTVFVNHGTHYGRMRWGRITALRYDWNQEVVQRLCAHHAQLGLTEGTAPPIS